MRPDILECMHQKAELSPIIPLWQRTQQQPYVDHHSGLHDTGVIFTGTCMNHRRYLTWKVKLLLMFRTSVSSHWQTHHE